MYRLFRRLSFTAGFGKAPKLRYRDCLYLRRLPRSRLVGITCRDRTDGGGAQIHGQMSALAFSHATGIPFFYSPPVRIEHGTGAEWIEKWDGLMDFRSGIDPLPANIPVTDVRGAYRSEPVIVSAPHFHSYCDRVPEIYLRVRDELRERCALMEPRVTTGVLAVHIRRGDIVDDPANAFRLTPMDRIAGVIHGIRRRKPHLRVSVYSEGPESDFHALPAGAELHLDGDPLQALSGLMNAEVLLMAKSSFSYIAGILSRGTVIYEPFWHPPLPGWTLADDIIM